MQRPEPTEYHPYFQRYMDLVGPGDFWELFSKNTEEASQFFSDIPYEKEMYSYAPGKWTIRQILMHIIDTERVFAYRALVCGREDSQTILPNMDENHYADHIDVSKIPLSDLIREFQSVRESNRYLFKGLSEAQTRFKINGPEKPFTARALGYLMMGHVLHHMQIIRERYSI
jgi:uncharacterized damage-inducible protein DinB